MVIAFGDLQKKVSRRTGILLGLAFLGASVFLYRWDNLLFSFGMGMLACTAIIMIAVHCKKSRIFDWFAKYTMPVFLMHILFAATFRVLLLKMGIHSPGVHIVVGITISFIGPVIAMRTFEKMRLDFLIYPRRLIRKM